MTSATRVMKARKNSLCGYCSGLVTRGQQIGLLDGTWQHVNPCILKQQASWSDAYPVDPEARRRAETARAIAWLATRGKRVS